MNINRKNIRARALYIQLMLLGAAVNDAYRAYLNVIVIDLNEELRVSLSRG